MRSVLYILLASVVSCQEPTKEKETVPPREIPVKLTDMDNRPFSLDQYKGKTVFINFWATWCKPCIQEMPSIESAQKALSKDGVVFLLASNETSDEINEFRQKHPSDLTYVRLVNMEELTMEGLPTTFIYNPKGERVFAEMGYRKWDDSTNIEMILKINNTK